MAIIDTENLELSHPSVGAISVFSRQRGFMPIEETEQGLQKAGLPQSLMPPVPGPSVALRRAVEDATKGDKNRRVESKGKRSGVVYSIINLDRDRIDLEEDNGFGIANAELSARIEKNGVGAYSLVITPEDHPQVEQIREFFSFHQENFKCSEDLSKWLSQTVFKSPLLKSVARPGHGGGMYYVPKAGFDLVLKIRDTLNEMSEFDHRNQLTRGVRLYTQPVFHGFSDCLDAMTDAFLDDFTKTCNGLESYLVGWEDGDAKVRWKGMETKAKEAEQLNAKLKAFKESCGLSVDDMSVRIKALSSRISMAQVALST